MKKQNILKICNAHKTAFAGDTSEILYELRGMFNSELLSVVSLIRHYKLPLLIESGRARGHSTEVISHCLPNIHIVSIDFDKRSKDAKFSERRLKKFNNLHLMYGDSNAILPKLVTKPCGVLIDGPKGQEALVLASNLLKNKNVKIIFIHDLHKNTFDRNICELVFNDCFFTDDQEYVKKFRSLDNNCWTLLRNYGEGPYLRKNKKMNSYAATMAVIFNSENPFNQPELSNFLEMYNRHRAITFRQYLGLVIRKNNPLSKTLLKIYNKLR